MVAVDYGDDMFSHGLPSDGWTAAPSDHGGTMFGRIGRWVATARPFQHAGVIVGILVLVFGAVQLFDDPLGRVFIPPGWLIAIPFFWLAYIVLWLMVRRN
jgi:hypothetical protein